MLRGVYGCYLVSELCLRVHMSITEHEKNENKSKIKHGGKGRRQYANGDPSKEQKPSDHLHPGWDYFCREAGQRPR